MCDNCRLRVAKRTFQRPDVRDILQSSGRGFHAYLSDDIISYSIQQKIKMATTVEKAFNHIHEVC